MTLAVSEVSNPKEFTGEFLNSSLSQSQTSVIINNKIDEGNDNNNINKENDEPIIKLNDSVRSNGDSPPLKKKKTIKSDDTQKIYNFYFN
jgi:hypothetical protein